MLTRLVLVGTLALGASPLVITPASASATIEGAFHGAFAEGAWQTSASSFGFTLVSREQDGTTHLSVHQFSGVTLDGDGNVTGGTEIKGETTSGVSFTIDTVHYTAASVRGVIPVSSCTIVDGVETGCVDVGQVALTGGWAGVGPIPHFPSTDLTWQDGCLQVDRNSSVERQASLTVSVALNGTPMSTSPTGFAGFGKGNSRVIVACPLGG